MSITIRPLEEGDLPEAHRIFRLAFGTFIGLPDPLSFSGDAEVVRTRWLTHPTAAMGAVSDGKLVGSNFAANLGSVGLFGPLTVHPDFWDRGIATLLMEPTLELFDQWGVTLAGLHTFAQSEKHIGLYQKFGFWPRFLTMIMSKGVGEVETVMDWMRFSQVPEEDREDCINSCRELTDLIYEGLDLEREIISVQSQGLGDTLLMWDDEGLAGFAVCHSGPRTEAGSGVCYVKFGAVRPGPGAGPIFTRLLETCEALAFESGMTQIRAGVCTARHEAYQMMLERGFRTEIQGVLMHKPNEPAYNRPGVFVIDDWR